MRSKDSASREQNQTGYGREAVYFASQQPNSGKPPPRSADFAQDWLPLQAIHTAMRRDDIRISDYDYPLPEERIAKFPLERRDDSKLLIYDRGRIGHSRFGSIGQALPPRSMLVFNNTKVIRARLIFFKESGARIEIFCLEPHDPADYERAFAVKGRCQWNAS